MGQVENGSVYITVPARLMRLHGATLTTVLADALYSRQWRGLPQSLTIVHGSVCRRHEVFLGKCLRKLLYHKILATFTDETIKRLHFCASVQDPNAA